MSAWAEFYKPKMNGRYLRSLKSKYAPFLATLAAVNPTSAHEMGCGAGNITRLLHDHFGWSKKHLAVSDLDVAMVSLSKFTLKDRLRNISQHDMTEEMEGRWGLIHSHGVLEHMDDSTIRKAIAAQKVMAKKLVHYVPSNKYNGQSFGDERLMSPEQWKELCNPDAIIPFNDGYDLMLTWG